MIRFLLRRLMFALVSLWALITIVFLMIKVIPGDQAKIAAGEGASPEMIELVRERLGLDQPLVVQYARYLTRLVQGDLGTSTSTFQPIADNLREAFPSTLELVLMSMATVVVFGVSIALLIVANRGGVVDGTVRVVAIAAAGMPLFWIAFMLQLGLSGTAIPISGAISPQYVVPKTTGLLLVDALLAGQPAAFGDALLHLVLPVVVLALPQTVVIIRTLRTSMLGEMHEEYILMARSKGASTARILIRHALPNAAVPMVTVLGLQVGYMLSGAVIIESIVARPGVGAYLTNSVLQKDTFAVLGTVLFIGVVVLVASLLVDLFQLAIDPRVRRGMVKRSS